MKIFLLALLPVLVFAVFAAGAWFLKFCFEHEARWWGGFPLWMAGMLGGLVPISVFGVLAIFYFAFQV